MIDTRSAAGRALAVLALAVAGCGDGGSSAVADGGSSIVADGPPGGTIDAGPLPIACSGDTATTFTPIASAPAAPAVSVASGLTLEAVARVPGARHLAALPNGDLLAGTNGPTVYIVPGAEADGLPGAPRSFVSIDDAPAHGVTFARESCTVYVGTQHGVYRMAYADGQQSATAGDPIARVRQINDDSHSTTSVAFAGGALYASIGSSCNACVEQDPTRATVQRMAPDGSGMTTRVRRTRNAIALAVNPATGTLWGGGAGQDDLPTGHPYEYIDAMGLHPAVADYGWPDCEEDRVAYRSGADCSQVVVPRVVLPAYSTIIGAVFYPLSTSGTYALPATWRGGLILGVHGSWHTIPGTNRYSAAPRVAFVAMNGDDPATPVSWSDPTTQWRDLVGGFQTNNDTQRIGRPTGVAVGSRGSVFIADDDTGLVYRIRPAR